MVPRNRHWSGVPEFRYYTNCCGYSILDFAGDFPEICDRLENLVKMGAAKRNITGIHKGYKVDYIISVQKNLADELFYFVKFSDVDPEDEEVQFIPSSMLRISYPEKIIEFYQSFMLFEISSDEEEASNSDSTSATTSSFGCPMITSESNSDTRDGSESESGSSSSPDFNSSFTEESASSAASSKMDTDDGSESDTSSSPCFSSITNDSSSSDSDSESDSTYNPRSSDSNDSDF